MNDILDLHTHTIASGHAYSTLTEMMNAAADRGLAIYGCSDHGPAMSGGTSKSYFGNFKVIPQVRRGVRILMGAELNILDTDGQVDLPPFILDKLDYTIASLHIPCFTPSSREDHTAAYLNAMKNPRVTIIGHPDDGRYPVDYKAFAQAAAEHGKLVEVNSSSLAPGSARVGAAENYKILLKYCREYQVPIIIGSDAHYEDDVANHRRAWELLTQEQFPQELIVNVSADRLKPYIPAVAELFSPQES